MKPDLENIKKILARRAEKVFPSTEEAVRRLAAAPQTIYWGIDPSSPSAHLGHSVPALLLKELGALGHKIIVLIGNFTAQIGDPTDKTAARRQLTGQEVAANMATYRQQLDHIFGEVLHEYRLNGEWLESFSLGKVIDLAGHVTVQQLIQRDMFQERLRQEKPIYLHEFLYPLLQGYDSVAMEVDGEIGGSDQIFNMLVGRDLVRDYNKKDKLVFGTRLLVDAASGKKMSKTEGVMIALTDSPADIFQKVSNGIPNEMIKTVFELCTEVDQDVIDAAARRVGETGEYKSWNKDLAEELVRIYHGSALAGDARRDYDALASGAIPKNIPEINHPNPAETSLAAILAEAGVAESKSAARRLIKQGAIRVNEVTVSDPLAPGNLKEGDILRVGSGKLFRFRSG